MFKKTFKKTGLFILAFASFSAHAVTLNFDTLNGDGTGAAYENGRIFDNEYASKGVTISAKNDGGGPDLAVGYDSAGAGSDPDLEDPWTMGNTSLNTVLDNVLIIQEHSSSCDTEVCTDPDDEGTRPAGKIYFDTTFDIASLAFTLLDVEGVSEYTTGGYVATFKNAVGAALLTIDFADFLAGGTYDNGAVYGNNSINLISAIDLTGLAGSVRRIEFNFGGSAAIDNVILTAVPAPAAFWLFGTALFGMLGIRLRRTRPA